MGQHSCNSFSLKLCCTPCLTRFVRMREDDKARNLMNNVGHLEKAVFGAKCEWPDHALVLTDGMVSAESMMSLRAGCLQATWCVELVQLAGWTHDIQF